MKKMIAIVFVCTLLTFGVALGGTVDYPITFTENPTTGYEWTYTVSDDTVLAVADEEYAAPDSEMAGAPGTHTWVLSGLKEGEASVIFTYARSWESAPDDPVVTMTFTVDADMNLTLSSSEGVPEKYMPDKAVVQLIEKPDDRLRMDAERRQGRHSYHGQRRLRPGCDRDGRRGRWRRAYLDLQRGWGRHGCADI